MDWYLYPTAAAVRRLRREADAYLRRHATADSDVDAATLVVSELLTNAVLHTRNHAWVTLDWSEEQPTLTVRDVGGAFEQPPIGLPAALSVGGRGLFLAAQFTERLDIAHRRAGGSSVSALLKVRRPKERSFRPRRVPHVEESLPALEEASVQGLFGRDPFLRALVVQLAQSLEAEHGPDAAEAAVTDVGSGVGAKIEQAYRIAHDLKGRLSSEQVADLLVRLKGAIDGDFYVIEADDEKIVLGNRRCPFGSAVQRSPALCRMTSSVFGGIAARNMGKARVYLEERIAVGDPECRVVVYFGDGGRTLGAAHEYDGYASSTPADDQADSSEAERR